MKKTADAEAATEAAATDTEAEMKAAADAEATAKVAATDAEACRDEGSSRGSSGSRCSVSSRGGSSR